MKAKKEHWQAYIVKTIAGNRVSAIRRAGKAWEAWYKAPKHVMDYLTIEEGKDPKLDMTWEELLAEGMTANGYIKFEVKAPLPEVDENWEPVISKRQHARIRRLQDRLRAMDERNIPPVDLDEFFEGLGQEGDFHWEADPVDSFTPSYDDDETWHSAQYAMEIGREDGKRFVRMHDWDQDGNHDVGSGYDEREGDTPENWHDVGTDIACDSFRNFVAWAEYHIWAAEHGKDPVKEWFFEIPRRAWVKRNIDAAQSNVSAAEKAYEMATSKK